MSDTLPAFDIEIQLAKPVTLGETHSVMVLREPSAGEWLEFEKLRRVEGMIFALSLISGIPRPAVQSLGVRDLRKGMNFLDAILYDAMPASEIGTGDEWTMQLRKPIVVGEVTYPELKLREPSASEWDKFDGLPGRAADIMALAVVSGIPELVLHKLGAYDLRKGASYIASFLFDDPSAGKAA